MSEGGILMNNVDAFKIIIGKYFKTYPSLKEGFNRFIINKDDENLIITINICNNASMITIENPIEQTKKCYYFSPDKVMQYIEFETISKDLAQMKHINVINKENETLVDSEGALLVTDSSLSCQNRIRFFMDNYLTNSLSDTIIKMEELDDFELAAFHYSRPHKLESDLLSQIETERKETDLTISAIKFSR